MRYLCVHCDHRWVVEGADAPKRCPSCMRATGIELVSDGAKKPVEKSSLRRFTPWAVLAALAIALVILLVARRSQAPASGDTLGPSDPTELAELMKKEQIESAGLEQLFAADEAMTALAEKTAGEKDGM